MKKKLKRIALFSVPIHDELELFARTLIENGWQIVATTDAATFLREKNIKTKDVSEFTGVHEDYGFPPTLHPKIEAALTTGFVENIELVYDIPYGIDIGNDVGGRTLLALAAKGNRVPVMNPEDMRLVVDCISKNGKVSSDLGAYLRSRANYEISHHYLSLVSSKNQGLFSGMMGVKHCLLKNGENMYQIPAILFDTGSDDHLSICGFKQVSGYAPCFTNIADLDSILETICKLQCALKANGISKSFIAVASKHGNACGVGVSSDDPAKAINNSLWGNARGIWGGEIITNFQLDAYLAKILKSSKKREQVIGNASWMLDVIAAPAITDPAVEILSQNPNRKLFVNAALSSISIRRDKCVFRPVRGGFISQPPADYIINLKKVEWTNPHRNGKDDISLLIAWATAFTSNLGGNEVAIAKEGTLIGAGGGPSTFDAANTAIARAKEQNHNIKGAVFGADAFFPFTDVPNILFRAGCKGGIAPRGGKREGEIIQYFKERKMIVGMIPEQYRGFCRH